MNATEVTYERLHKDAESDLVGVPIYGSVDEAIQVLTNELADAMRDIRDLKDKVEHLEYRVEKLTNKAEW